VAACNEIQLFVDNLVVAGSPFRAILIMDVRAGGEGAVAPPQKKKWAVQFFGQ